MARPIIVLGMHRSGTSAVTRVINLLGLPLGPERDLYEGYHNPTGYWESLTLVYVNARILNAFLGTWKYPPDLPLGWHRARRARRMLPAMQQAFRSIYPGEPWVWKDPRTCLTLPLWRTMLDGCDPAVVFVSRSPGSVARSLVKRGGVSREMAVALWERYNRSALTAARRMPFVHIRYEDLVGAPVGTIAHLQAQLRSIDVAVVDDATRALEHISARSDQAVSPPLSVEQTFLMDQISGLPDVMRSFDPPPLGEETPSTRRVLRLPIRMALRIRLKRIRRPAP